MAKHPFRARREGEDLTAYLKAKRDFELKAITPTPIDQTKLPLPTTQAEMEERLKTQTWDPIAKIWKPKTVEPIKPIEEIKPIKPIEEITPPTEVKPIGEAKAITDLKTQIADIQSKIAVATTAFEKEQSIEEITKLWASLGLKYDPAVIAALSGPTGEAEEVIRKEIYDKYGIGDLEAKFKTRPTQTFEEIYTSAYTTLGLAQIKTDIDAVRVKIDKADADYNEAVGDINENPWLSEASRVGRISQVTAKYERTRIMLTGQMTLLENVYSRGKEESENVATRALSEFARERAWTKEELSYYVKRAEADIEAKVKVGEIEAAKERYRYLKPYLEAIPPEVIKPTSAEEKATKKIDDRNWVDELFRLNPDATYEELDDAMRANTTELTDSDIKAKLKKEGKEPTEEETKLTRENMSELYGIPDDDEKTGFLGFGKTNREKLDEIMDIIEKYRVVGYSDAGILKEIRK